MGGAVGWILRVFGLGRWAPPPASPPPPPRPLAESAARGWGRGGQPSVVAPPVGSDEFRLARRRVIAYVAQARTPIRQAAAIRQIWLADLSKVYAQIASSPTGLVLDRAGAVGLSHEPGFREALAFAQSIDPPPEAENAHAALVGWLTCLHAACLALMDARKLRDRSLLGSFREQLGFARRLAVVLVQERAALFAAYRLTMRPSIKSKRYAPVAHIPPPGAKPPARRAGSADQPARPSPPRRAGPGDPPGKPSTPRREGPAPQSGKPPPAPRREAAGRRTNSRDARAVRRRGAHE